MASPILIRIPPTPDPQRLTLPGGVSIEHLELVEVIQPALTPLMPFFDILETVLALFDAVKAVPDTIGPPPDPTALAEALQKVAEKVVDLLRLVPQLSLPFTILGLVDLILHTLSEARDVLVGLQARGAALGAAEERARELGDAQLLEIVECARANIEQEAANLGKRLGALGTLVGILNLFTSMVGAPEVPDLSSLSGESLDAVVEPLDALVDVLTAVRSAVPLP
ncbi:MAG: hypothetical protein SangKO_067010 [Sandaracinaceae bacterium]